jgi:hypothetical protein
MANRVEYAVSVTPIRTIAGVSGKYAEQDVIEADINKTLGGSDSIPTNATDISVDGFTAGTVAYGNCAASGKLEVAGTVNAALDMLFIKHTGYQWGGDATTLGTVSTATNNLNVFVEHSAGAFTQICSIAPGGAIALPEPPALGSGLSFHVESSGSESIAVEFAAIT